jgi:membrane carboxypeptidase/penicillin-binding protein
LDLNLPELLLLSAESNPQAYVAIDNQQRQTEPIYKHQITDRSSSTIMAEEPMQTEQPAVEQQAAAAQQGETQVYAFQVRWSFKGTADGSVQRGPRTSVHPPCAASPLLNPTYQ